MSAGKLVKGIVRRLLNTSSHHSNNHSSNCSPSKDFSRSRHDDDSDSCWRRYRRNSQRSKQQKKSEATGDHDDACDRSLMLPDIVPRTDGAKSPDSCHSHHHHHRHHRHRHPPHHHREEGAFDDGCRQRRCCGCHCCSGDNDFSNAASRAPDPVCTCEDCYVVLMNICRESQRHGEGSTCCRLCQMPVSPRRSEEGARASRTLQATPKQRRRPSSSAVGRETIDSSDGRHPISGRSQESQKDDEGRIISSDQTSLEGSRKFSGPSPRAPERQRISVASRIPTPPSVDLPQSVRLSKDGEQSYKSYVRSLKSGERISASYHSSIVPPNRTICHVTAGAS